MTMREYTRGIRMRKIGIDAGGSLIKLAYEENGKIHMKKYTYDEKENLLNWLQILASDAMILGTGGRFKELEQFINIKKETVDEFSAVVRGTDYFLDKEGHSFKEYILVNIGTGTSIFHVRDHSFERITGTGIGGGTWLGLGSLLANGNNFYELNELAKTGDRLKCDLLVKDIYGDLDSPLAGEMTAANFGKAHLSTDQTINDQLRALAQMIGEVIVSLAGNAALGKKIGEIVFIGSTLEGNSIFRDVLASFQQLLPYRPIFVRDGAYAGAVGSILE